MAIHNFLKTVVLFTGFYATVRLKNIKLGVAIQVRNEEKLKLRFKWTNLEPLTELGRRISNHQTNRCELPLANYRHREALNPEWIMGLGSDIHVWSQALCHGVEYGYRLRTLNPWIWIDEEACRAYDGPEANKNNVSSLSCYFPQSELMCPNDLSTALQDDAIGGIITYNIATDNIHWPGDCPTIKEKYGIPGIRAAAMEFLFTKVSPIIEKEAQRQLKILFGELGYVPKNLITVHIRWGDKNTEMNLVDIDTYIMGVKALLYESGKKSDANEPVSIFLASEDPKAVQMFKEAAPADWNIYLDVFYQEMNQYHADEYNNNPKMTQLLRGRPGLITLGSLLVAMEANNFVLTTASNWSRLMNELRKNVLEPRCPNCTRMIDLSAGEYRRRQ